MLSFCLILFKKNRDHLEENLPLLPPKLATPQKTLEYLSEQLERQQQAGNLSYYIFHNDKLCGFIGTNSVEYSDKTELTYWLTNESQGKGFMRAALKSVEKQHFKNTSNTLVGVILRSAQRSARLLSNIGTN